MSHCVIDDGMGRFGLMWRQESGKDYYAPMWEVGSRRGRNQVFRDRDRTVLGPIIIVI